MDLGFLSDDLVHEAPPERPACNAERGGYFYSLTARTPPIDTHKKLQDDCEHTWQKGGRHAASCAPCPVLGRILTNRLCDLKEKRKETDTMLETLG
jgi:hypothetical protein